MRNRRVLQNCYKCGKFVGKDGNQDVHYDYYTGMYEAGYPECKKCIDKRFDSEKRRLSK